MLFDLLVKADRKNGTRRSNRYYELAMRLAHVTAATDLVPSSDEIQAIDAYRTRLLQAMDAAGVPRPGQPDAPARTPTPAARRRNRGHGDSGICPAATEPVLPPARSIDEVMAELDSLIGLANVKAEVRRLTSMLQVQQIRAERGLPVIETSHHLVFTGNPGTGKTTVARLLSQIYRAVGVVSKGHLVETDRSKLVAGFVGQTALKTLRDAAGVTRRDAADRRGVRAGPRWRERLRTRGNRHVGEVHGGSSRRPGHRRRRIHRRRWQTSSMPIPA